MAVADVYDALTTARPYKRAFSHAEAQGMLCEQAEKSLDAGIVSALGRVPAERREAVT